MRYRWLSELRRKCPGVPRILIGLKSDLRNKIPNPLTLKDGEIMQFDTQSCAYFDFSITKPKICHEIFTEAVRVGLQKKIHVKKQSCCIQ